MGIASGPCFPRFCAPPPLALLVFPTVALFVSPIPRYALRRSCLARQVACEKHGVDAPCTYVDGLMASIAARWCESLLANGLVEGWYAQMHCRVLRVAPAVVHEHV